MYRPLLRTICSTALLAVLAPAAWGAPITATWTAGVTDNWNNTANNAANWTFSTPPASAVFPTNSGGDTFDVLIDNGGAGNSTVNLNTNVTIDSLGVSGADTLNFNNSIDMTITSGSVVNNGSINLNSSGPSTDLNLLGAATINGTGTIGLSNNSQNRILGSVGNVISQGAGHTIRGSGQLLSNIGGFSNQGTIVADQSIALTIDPGAEGFDNTNGILRATSNATLNLNSGLYTNSTGLIEANGAGAIVNLNASVVVQGGNLATTGTGQIRANANGPGQPVLDGVTVTAGSNLVQNNSFDLTIRNGITNGGTWNLNSAGSAVEINFSGSQTIAGSGEIVMTNNGGNRVLTSGTTAATDVITLGANQTIRGAGSLLLNTGGLVSDGAIIQQGSVALSVDPGTADAGGGANAVLNGVFRAEGSGGIRLNGGIYDNNTTIEAADGSVVQLNAGSAIIGGNLATAGSGQILTNVNGAGRPVLDGVTVTAGSNLVQNNSFDLTIRNGITNDGTWNLNSAGSAADINFEGSQTIAGNGELVMTNNAVNRILTSGASAATDVITLGANQTIRGAGSLLLNSGGFVNNGTIDATGSSAPIFINAGIPGFVNNGTLRASGGAGIDIDASSDQFTQAGGLVNVQATSRLDVTLGNYTQTGGQTTVNGILTTNGPSSTIELQGGRFGGSGTVDFNGIGSHSFNNVGGTLAVGNSPGQLTITDGDYVQQAAASFEFELFGAVAGVSHDLLTILNGDASLAGSLDIVAGQLFASTLTIGDQFEVIQLDPAGLFIGGDFFDTLTVNLSGLSFVQFFASNSLGGTSLFLEVTQADFVVSAPEGLAIMLTGLSAMGWLRRRRRIR